MVNSSLMNILLDNNINPYDIFFRKNEIPSVELLEKSFLSKLKKLKNKPEYEYDLKILKLGYEALQEVYSPPGKEEDKRDKPRKEIYHEDDLPDEEQFKLKIDKKTKEQKKVKEYNPEDYKRLNKLIKGDFKPKEFNALYEYLHKDEIDRLRSCNFNPVPNSASSKDYHLIKTYNGLMVRSVKETHKLENSYYKMSELNNKKAIKDDTISSMITKDDLINAINEREKKTNKISKKEAMNLLEKKKKEKFEVDSSKTFFQMEEDLIRQKEIQYNIQKEQDKDYVEKALEATTFLFPKNTRNQAKRGMLPSSSLIDSFKI